ncbi:uncharacterized protein LOC127800435 isoform X2 [Diospyros lotus]|uniref:uncharacterized protein LOC127800435 isoform X2 n=1 Tax=Diospyros lotus TaxID=55363 RepID=UPI0022545A6E|nr:uncharacterized protein LOC127800435 isoform X2 [Diospyros lotus]
MVIMAKVSKVHQKSNSRCRKVASDSLSSHLSKVLKNVHQKKKGSKVLKKKEWENATCSVCMEYPHNSVLLLCSSYNNGCRPYMCATSDRYSNCLEQYKKAYTKVTSVQMSEPSHESIDHLFFSPGLGCPNEKREVPELLCPLCRGQVKGWTVVEPARKYFNTKRRTCAQDNCSFVGTYKELRKHARVEHPLARPREVDPSLAEKWKRLEHERERDDVISTIRSSMPGAIVIGDYVIETNNRFFPGGYNMGDYLGDAIVRFESFGGGRNGHVNSDELFGGGYHLWDEEDDVEMDRDGLVPASVRFDDNYTSRFTRYRSRFLSRRMRRRRRRGATNGGR